MKREREGKANGEKRVQPLGRGASWHFYTRRGEDMCDARTAPLISFLSSLRVPALLLLAVRSWEG